MSAQSTRALLPGEGLASARGGRRLNCRPRDPDMWGGEQQAPRDSQWGKSRVRAEWGLG